MPKGKAVLPKRHRRALPDGNGRLTRDASPLIVTRPTIKGANPMLSRLIATTALALFAAPALADYNLTILHTNDFHDRY